MTVEDQFLKPNLGVEKYKIRPQIESSEEYVDRKEKRGSILKQMLNQPSSPEQMMENINKLVTWRLDKQEGMRDQLKKTGVQLREEYDKRYQGIKDGDYSSTEDRRQLYAKMTREAAYYELTPDAEWGDDYPETDGEIQEREFVRGAVAHKFLKPLGLSDMEMVDGNLDPDQGDLEINYSKPPEKLAVFDKATAKKALDNLFALKTKVDREAFLDDMKSRFGCQEVIYILEDIIDSHEGYKENTNDILGRWDGADNLIDDYKEQAALLIESSRGVFERYQKWDEHYLVNNDLGIDNLSSNGLPINWDNVGVTNNYLNALIFDYGQLRLSAWENGQEEFVEALDEELMEKFREMGDEEAGQTVIRLATLRSFSDKASDISDDDVEEKERIKKELLKIFE